MTNGGNDKEALLAMTKGGNDRAGLFAMTKGKGMQWQMDTEIASSRRSSQ
jgi:hypothetical protein